MNLENIKRILADKVLIEAATETTSPGGIIIPLQALSRYPQIGWVVATGPKCREGLKKDDLVLLIDEGCDQGHAYYQTLALILKGWDSIEYCDIDIWPIIKETVETYRRTGNDKVINIKTIESGWLTLLASDVLEYTIADLSDPALRLEYVSAIVLRLEVEDRLRMFYIIPESQIPAILET